MINPTTTSRPTQLSNKHAALHCQVRESVAAKALLPDVNLAQAAAEADVMGSVVRALVSAEEWEKSAAVLLALVLKLPAATWLYHTKADLET